MSSELPVVVPEQERSTKSYRGRVISVVSVGLVVAGGALMVSASRGSNNNDATISNLVAVDGHKSATAAVVPSWDAKAVVSSASAKVVATPKEGVKSVEVKKVDDKKDVESREEIDGGKPVSKKTAKPTVKPTTPPKPTVPPTTKKPSEKKDVLEREEAPKGKAPPARSLAEKGNPSPESNPASGRQEVAHKSAAVPTEKKGDEKKDVEPREEIDGAKAKKTSKPTVKPTTPPKPTVPPTTKKPSEKKDVEKVEGPKQHPSRSLAEVKKGAAPAPKKDTMSPPKKEEAPKEEKKDVEPREEVDGGKPVSKKTSKPTVKPTTPPKPTVPPTTKKPSEKKDVKEVTPKGGKADAMAPPKNDHRQLNEESLLSKALKDAEVKAYKEEKVSAKDEKPSAKKVDTPKKDDAPKEEKKDAEPREIDGAKAKKTSKPTVKPTTPPKPTVPPTTKKPAEKHNVQDSKFDRSPRQLKKSSSLESTVSEAPAPVTEVAVDAPAISEEDRHTATDERADGPKGMFPSFIFQPVTSYHPTTSLTLYNYFISISLISTSVNFF